jgi:hypothetical protein
MGKRILAFNVIYYGVTLLLIKLGREDASSSLGYGFFIIAFWIIAAIVLAVLIFRKSLRPKSIAEKIGIFTATPVLSIIAISLILAVKEDVASERYFNEGSYRYKVRTINYKEKDKVKRIEFYSNKISATAVDDGW